MFSSGGASRPVYDFFFAARFFQLRPRLQVVSVSPFSEEFVILDDDPSALHDEIMLPVSSMPS
jgi:hypothetical protein